MVSLLCDKRDREVANFQVSSPLAGSFSLIDNVLCYIHRRAVWLWQVPFSGWLPVLFRCLRRHQNQSGVRQSVWGAGLPPAHREVTGSQHSPEVTRPEQVPPGHLAGVGGATVFLAMDGWLVCKLRARFMRPTWGPPGSCRPQVGPRLAREFCYQGKYELIR